MVDFTKTPRYVSHVSQLVAERTAIQGELDLLARTKRGTRTDEQASRIAQIKGRLKTLTRNIDGAPSLNTFTWPELFHLYSDVHGWIWNAAELELLQQDRASYEGGGEKPIFYRLGLPIVSSTKDHDLPDGSEVKWLNDVGEPFRVGKVGKKAWGTFSRDIIRSNVDDAFDDETWEFLSIGEVSAGKVYHEFPIALRTRLQRELAPEKVLNKYPAFYLTTEVGFIYVPREDYPLAFSLACVTQMSPKYRLRRDYVEQCLLATQDASDVAA